MSVLSIARIRRKAAAARDEAAAGTAEAAKLEACLREVRCKGYLVSRFLQECLGASACNPLNGLDCAWTLRWTLSFKQVIRCMSTHQPTVQVCHPHASCYTSCLCLLALCHVQVRGRAAQRRSEAAAQSSQGGVVKALLAARASGEIAGIHGRLGVPAHRLASSLPSNCKFLAPGLRAIPLT